MLTLVEKHSKSFRYSERQEVTRRLELPPLTTEELCQVNLATIREGINHCCWPKEVIERFLVVEV